MDNMAEFKDSLVIRFLVITGAVISVIVAILFYGIAKNLENQAVSQVDLHARALIHQISHTRAWVADQADGGVYAQVAGDVDPNPYLLQIPDFPITIEDQEGVEYTLRSHDVITREIAELARAENNIAIRIFSLEPFNPDNGPSPWEEEALNKFELGSKEAIMIDKTEREGEVFRYIAPLYVTESCMKCHASQGYQVGGVGGGISVTLPMTETRAAIKSTNQQLFFLGLGILVVTLITLAGIVYHQVYLPLVQLNQAATTASRGDLKVQVLVRSQDEFGSLATAFNTMTSHLNDKLQGLDRSIEVHMKALETSTEISRRLSATHDQNQMVREVVVQLQSAFGYYHVHIYLFDETGDNLVLVGGTGNVGRTMLAAGHKLSKGQGLVGRAAVDNQIVLIPDVFEAPGWLPNSLLPETKAELAVPIAIGHDVLGVLDVQHNFIEGLSEIDSKLMQAVSAQLAVAMQNARAFAKTQRLAERESLLASLNQRIQSAGSVEDVLQVAVTELNRALGARRSKVELKSSVISGDESNLP